MLELDTAPLLRVAEYLKPKEFGQLKQTCHTYNALLDNTVTTGRVMGNSKSIHLGYSNLDKALIIADKIGRIDVVWWVINKAITERDIGFALYHTATRGHTECVQFLINHPMFTIKNGWDPLRGAIACGHTECAQLLRNAGFPDHEIDNHTYDFIPLYKTDTRSFHFEE